MHGRQLVRTAMRSKRLVGWAALLAALALPVSARAQGFGLSEIGSCAVGRGQAVTGAPCQDASAIYWNPAAPAGLRGLGIYAGAAIVALGGAFTADTTGVRYPGAAPTEVPPHVFVSYGTGSFAAGLGVYVPYGLTSQWAEDFPGRFSAMRASLGTIYIQPNVAVELVRGRLSIGGGPVIGRSTVELVQALDLSQQFVMPGVTFAQAGVAPGTEFGRATLTGDAWAYGFHVGLQARLTPTLTVGARYLSRLRFRYDDARATFSQTPTGLVLADTTGLSAALGGAPPGTPYDALLAGQFSGSGALTGQGVRTRIDHPAQAAMGLGYTGLANTTLSADVLWVDWSAFRELPVTFTGPAAANSRTLIEDYRDSWSFRAGLERRFRTVAGRAGFSYVRTPVPDVTVSPLLPDMNRYNFTLGAGIPIAGRFALDAAYLRVETPGRRGRIVERTSRTQTAAELNGGFYELNANIFSVSLKATF